MFPPLTPIEKLVIGIMIFIFFVWLIGHLGCNNPNPIESMSMNMTEDTPLEGELYGVLEPGIYYITGDITVPEDCTLTIYGSAYFMIMEHGIGWYIYGNLEVNGLPPNDVVRFNSITEDIYWLGLNFMEGSTGHLRGCHIYRAGFIATPSTDWDLTHGGGIYANRCELTLDSVVIGHSAAYEGGGIYVTNLQDFTMSRCAIWSCAAINAGGGIQIDSSNNVRICSTQVGKCSAMGFVHNPWGAGGIGFRRTTNILMDYCIVYENATEKCGAGIRFWRSGPIAMTHCTITSNHSNNTGYDGAGIFATGGETQVTYVNGITYDNTIYDEVNDYEGAIIVSWSLSTEPRVGWGNIYGDPMFADQYYRLMATSPCIDTGDPSSPLDPDGTRADMGAHYYHQD